MKKAEKEVSRKPKGRSKSLPESSTKPAKKISKKEFQELYQFKIKDTLHKTARTGADYWYGGVWQSVNKCVLCDLRARYIITELDNMVLTVNIYPYIDGNLMIVPRRHITHVKEMTMKEWEAVRTLHYVARKMLKTMLGVRGLWLLYREGGSFESSEKTVEHLHVHLLPYKRELLDWNYQELNFSPFEVAASFRDQSDTIEKLIERYKRKYI